VKVLVVAALLPVCMVSAADSPRPAAFIEAVGEQDDAAPSYNLDEPAPPIAPAQANLPVSAFSEVWAYVVSGREASYTPSLPISDIGYFGADVNLYGELVGVPNPKTLRNMGFKGQIHLVVACTGRALTHFVLAPGAVRNKLIADLLDRTLAFDGLQIDFENVPPRDRDAFHSFLAALWRGVGKNKMFSIAIRALVRDNDPVYDYSKIKPITDRMLVMAYDEHWSTSEAGPIASMAWCNSVAKYALSVIGREKLVMGLPFYGRTWASERSSGDYIYSSIEKLKDEHHVSQVQRDDGIPHFTYQQTVTVTAYYEDTVSLSRRMELYRSLGVKSIGFWRLGQEIPSVWDHIKLD
jgi:spore germination protein YaaH